MLASRYFTQNRVGDGGGGFVGTFEEVPAGILLLVLLHRFFDRHCHHTTIMAAFMFGSTKKVAPSDSPTLVTSTVVRTIYPPLPASDSGRWGFNASNGLVKPALRKELLLL